MPWHLPWTEEGGRSVRKGGKINDQVSEVMSWSFADGSYGRIVGSAAGVRGVGVGVSCVVVGTGDVNDDEVLGGR